MLKKYYHLFYTVITVSILAILLSPTFLAKLSIFGKNSEFEKIVTTSNIYTHGVILGGMVMLSEIFWMLVLEKQISGK